MSFNPRAYWTRRGRIYEQQAKDGGWWDGEQEHLPELLDTLYFSNVLEVGCGFGRVGASIKSRWPDVAYTGIDISADLVKGARKRLPDSEIIEADMVTFEPSYRRWDLVLAISALSHIPPEDIAGVIAKLKAWARRDIVVVDWNEVGASTPYQHAHDVKALLGLPDGDDVNGPGQTATDGRLSLWHLRM